MAGGWGATVQVPMEVDPELFNRYLADDMPEVVFPREMPMPEMKDASAAELRVKNKALPRKPGGEITTRGRMEDAAEMAAAMGAAFEITKAYNQKSKSIAKAKGKAQARLSKTYGKESLKGGKKRSRYNKGIERQSMRRAAQYYGYNPYYAMY